MFKRIVVGTVLIALVAVVLWMDWWMEQTKLPLISTGAGGNTIPLKGLPLTVLSGLAVIGGYFELARMMASAGLPIFRYGGLFCTLLVATLPFWRQVVCIGPQGDASMQVVLACVLLLLFADQWVHYRTQDAMRRIGASLLAVCYLGVCMAVLLGMRLAFGLGALVLFLAVVKSADVGAYLAGKAIGRHKLAPWLSPGKTWEGLIGGLALAAACAACCVAGLAGMREMDGGGVIWGRIDWATFGWAKAVAFGLALGLTGQIGDLCESTMKRDAGLKDSGRFVPGFGGVLDVLDSPLLAAPIGYVLLALLH